MVCVQVPAMRATKERQRPWRHAVGSGGCPLFQSVHRRLENSVTAWPGKEHGTCRVCQLSRLGICVRLTNSMESSLVELG